MSRATRLGILIGIAAALAFFAWRVIDEYERELTQLRHRPAVLPPGWIAVPAARPGRPKPRIGPDGPPPGKTEGGATVGDWALLVVLLAIVTWLVVTIAFGPLT